MEGDMNIRLLFLLLALPHIYTYTFKKKDCLTIQDNYPLCHNDYNRTINCVWDSTKVTDQADTSCTIHAESDSGKNGYSSSCKMQPVDVSRPMLKKCSLVFQHAYTFMSSLTLNLTLSCNTMKPSLSVLYKPACQIKLNPPPKPDINSTTISWMAIVKKHYRIQSFCSQLQWKQEDQPWRDPPFDTECKFNCTKKLDQDDLIQGEKYSARVRVKECKYVSTWSDWSPTASWVSPIGRAMPPTLSPPLSDVVGGVLGTFACAAAFALLLILLKTDKTTWIYIGKKIRGPPLPNPRKSFLQDINFQNWLSPHFNGEPAHSFLNPVDIASVEILQLITKGGNDKHSEPLAVVSDYENVKKAQVEHCRLQSLDSGVCSSEEVSQESLEADSINVTDCNDEEPEGTKESDGGKVNFQMLFRASGAILNQGSIQVSSGYEQVHVQPPDSPELPSLDSGISSGGEDQIPEETLEDKSTESTSLQCSPRLSSCSFPPLTFNFSTGGWSPLLQPLPSHIQALLSTNISVEPSSDGYLPVNQECK